jgi:hypothetical protein
MNFGELRIGEVRRILLLGNSVNKGNKKGKSRGPNHPGSSSARLAPELPLGLGAFLDLYYLVRDVAVRFAVDGLGCLSVRRLE